jgi:EmrB/QacA subfamily drug resistance transporter
MDKSPDPASPAALRDALLKGREPPPAESVAALSSYRWLVVGTVCIGAFMGQVDSSIAQLVLPRLEADFDARLSTVSWVAIAYLLTMAGFLPIFGRLADMLGRKLLYTGGFLLFVLGSGLCGFAPNLPALIAFRVLQAIGAALLSSNSVAIVVTAAGPERRGKALGIMAAAQAVGLSAGPALGGVVLDMLGWQWVFWINVPVGLVACVIGWFVLPVTGDLGSDSRFDWKGALLILPALTVLIAAVNEAHVWGIASPALLASLLLGLACLALFVFWERRAAAPLVDLALFRNRPFALGNAASVLSYAMLFGLFFLMPFIFIRVYQETALVAGFRLSIVPVMLGLTAPFSGALSDHLGPRLLTVLGMLVCVAALVLLYVVTDGTPAGMPMVMLALAVVGVGQGLFASPNNNSIMAAAPANLTGEAGSLMNVMRSVGMSIGIAAAAAVLSWRLEVLTGHGGGRTVGVADVLLAAAGRDVMLVLAGFAAMAAVISLARMEVEEKAV